MTKTAFWTLLSRTSPTGSYSCCSDHVLVFAGIYLYELHRYLGFYQLEQLRSCLDNPEILMNCTAAAAAAGSSIYVTEVYLGNIESNCRQCTNRIDKWEIVEVGKHVRSCLGNWSRNRNNAVRKIIARWENVLGRTGVRWEWFFGGIRLKCEWERGTGRFGRWESSSWSKFNNISLFSQRVR